MFYENTMDREKVAAVLKNSNYGVGRRVRKRETEIF